MSHYFRKNDNLFLPSYYHFEINVLYTVFFNLNSEYYWSDRNSIILSHDLPDTSKTIINVVTKRESAEFNMIIK